MSVQAITAALAIQGVTSSEKLLLIVLANYADEHMKCWPSHSRLARNTCMSDRTILRLFMSLEKRGLLSRKARYKNKVRNSDLVTLTLGGDTMSPYGDNDDKKVGTPCREGGDTMSPKPIKEPKDKPSERAREARLADRQPPALAELDEAAIARIAEERAEIAAGLKDLAKTLGGGSNAMPRLRGRAA